MGWKQITLAAERADARRMARSEHRSTAVRAHGEACGWLHRAKQTEHSMKKPADSARERLGLTRYSPVRSHSFQP
eukprot:3832749-Rhodomonas_salina.1